MKFSKAKQDFFYFETKAKTNLESHTVFDINVYLVLLSLQNLDIFIFRVLNELRIRNMLKLSLCSFDFSSIKSTW